MNRCADRWTEKKTDRSKDTNINREMDGQVDGQTDVWKYLCVIKDIVLYGPRRLLTEKGEEEVEEEECKNYQYILRTLFTIIT